MKNKKNTDDIIFIPKTKYIYYVLGFPHLICYLYYRKKIKEIDLDLSVWTDGKIGSRAFLGELCKMEYRTVFYYRIPFIIRHLLKCILPRAASCYIQCNSIAGGMKIHHGWSAIILAETIGKNFQFYQNVTVGYGKRGKPSIGENVIIYTGAVVVGGIKIGNNVRIAANTVVRHDVPDNFLVYGNPCTMEKTTFKQ